MHHEEIELNFEAACQQILGLESEILWEARCTPTIKLTCFVTTYGIFVLQASTTAPRRPVFKKT
jgi:hypothetical protein